MKQTPQELAQKSLANGSPTDWFEVLYAQSDVSGDGIPWAKLKPNPYLVHWLDQNRVAGTNHAALVVGCGLGDDAIEVEKRGFDVTAFDVSESAIQICRQRFPESGVKFQQVDLLHPPDHWDRHFDFVFESLTVQSLPPDYQETAMHRIGSFVKPEGQLVVFTWLRSQKYPLDGPPWLLLPSALDEYETTGLTQQHLFKVQHSPHVWPVVAVYKH